MSAPFQLTGIDHVVLLVGNMDRATAFYTGVIGCTIEKDQPRLALRQLRAGAALIDLVAVGSEQGAWARPEVAGGRNVDHVALGLEPANPYAVRRHLTDHGVEIIEEGDRTGALGNTLSFYIRDPDGNQIELSFPPG